MVSVGMKQHLKKLESSELMSCVKVEVDVLGSVSLTARTVSVNVKQHLKKKLESSEFRSCVEVAVDVLAPRP